MGKHYPGNGREVGKKGLTVDVKHTNHPEAMAKAIESAIKTLKRRVVQEGLIRDMRKKEYHETRGQIRRKRRQEAIRRQAKKNRLPAE